jgi:hypothetical protein
MEGRRWTAGKFACLLQDAKADGYNKLKKLSEL